MNYKNKVTKVNVYDKQLDKYEEYKGKVYCCSVPGDGVIYIKNQGKYYKRVMWWKLRLF